MSRPDPNVVHDPRDPLGAWRLWYGGCQCKNAPPKPDPACCHAQFLMYANSSDGIEWTKPSLGLYDATRYFPQIPKERAKDNNVR